LSLCKKHCGSSMVRILPEKFVCEQDCHTCCKRFSVHHDFSRCVALFIDYTVLHRQYAERLGFFRAADCMVGCLFIPQRRLGRLM